MAVRGLMPAGAASPEADVEADVLRGSLVDFTVYPNTRIGRLPTMARPFALLARNLAPASWRRSGYAYRCTDLATSGYCPFLDDPAFNRIYDRVAGYWYKGKEDVRWRVWILSRLARLQRGLPAGAPGNFAEFGVYRGGCTFIVLATTGLPPSQRYFLFDTFQGVPEDRLVDQERRMRIGGEWANTSEDAVAELLAPWRAQVEICKGDVFETLKEVETGKLSFVHIDLNASAPTVLALEYAYARMVPGAIVVFDDYGAPRYMEQRLRIDEFFAERPEDVVALPTGQAFAVKR